MSSMAGKLHDGAKIVLWVARVWSLINLGFVILIMGGELLTPHAPPPTSARDIISMAFFLGMCLGLVIAWRWEAIGGVITLAGLAAFYITLYLADGRLPRGPYFVLVAAPGILFLVHWAMTHHEKGTPGG